MLEYIKIEKLKQCPIQLRTVKTNSLEYLELLDSIRSNGFFSSILVRPSGGYYEVISGAYCLSIAKQLGIKELPCLIKELTDHEVYTQQLRDNRIPPTSNEVLSRLRLIIHLDQDLTLFEVTSLLNKNIDWTKRVLKLDQLSDKTYSLLEVNKLPLAIALELVNLPHERQDDLVKLFGRLPDSDFIELAREKSRHLRQGKKQTRLARNSRIDYKLRPRKEIIHEMLYPTEAASVLDRCNATTLIEAWQAALKFVNSVDPETYDKRMKK